ncbi:MAG: hypothetical protein EOP45_14985, partial [Sphingobacteriaceae bacterium]
MKIYALNNLPYPAILIPLATFFASLAKTQVRVSTLQKEQIIQWFWRTCFNKRYNSQPAKTIQSDIEGMLKLKVGEKSSLLNFPYSLTSSDTFKNELFRTDSVLTKTFVLLLAHKNPLTFISGSPISLATTLKNYNKNEFHHLYPKKFVSTLKGSHTDVNCLANLCFMSRADNNSLGGFAPSIYRAKMDQRKDVQLKIV